MTATPAALGGALLVLAWLPPSLAAQVRDTTLDRPTDIRLTVSNDPHLDGIYIVSDTARICGKFDLGMPERALSFTVEFPNNLPTREVSSVSFHADTLTAGQTTQSYYLSASLNNPRVGQPPALVVRANQPQYQEPGTATLLVAGSTATLRIDGIASRGTKVRLQMEIVCHPAP